jgi:transcriptional regulator with XRE-family HTH domain
MATPPLAWLQQESSTMVARPHRIDVHVGSRVRLRRTLLGFSQERLGAALGLTFQQVQKYERGANRIGSSRLYELSRILDVPVSFFFDDIPGAPAETGSAGEAGPDARETSQMSRRETMELVRAYYRIEDPLVRKRVFDLVKAIGGVITPDVAAALETTGQV